MGFNSVYQCLLDIFPKVDSRLLRAVAIEHSKDADAAVEIVLSEIIPYLSQQQSMGPRFTPNEQRPGVASSSTSKDKSPIVASSSSSSTPKDQSPRQHSNGGVDHEQSNRQVLMVKNAASSSGAIASEDARSTDLAHGTQDSRALNASTISNYYDANESDELILLGKAKENVDQSQVCVNIGSVKIGSVNIESKETVSLDKSRDINLEVEVEVEKESTCTPSGAGNSSLNGLHNEWKDFDGPAADDLDMIIPPSGAGNSSLNGLHNEWKDFDGPAADDFDMIIPRKSQNCLAFLHNEWKDFGGPAADDFDMIIPRKSQNCLAELVSSSVLEHKLDDMEPALHSEFESVIPVIDCEEPEAGGAIDFKSKQDNISELGDIGDEPTLNTIVTRSGQICSIDLLEDIIEDAKNNKKTLFSAMESIMSMMKEVELRERAAEQAKEEAAKGGLDILDKVEELKQMLTHAKEANDMHAGEVYGERAILATEVRELQTRLLSLSEERDNSLAIIDEMHQTLESRLAVAEELIKSAEQEKLEKDESARNALAEQETIMEKIVQESRILKQEAEENSKLRDFLMDRGLIVDTLQGEISVICQDVRLLKENFDDRVPLSKSISSSQTSCILASSGSSLKSMASDMVPEQFEKSKILKEGSSVDGQSLKTSPTPSIDDQSPKNGFEDESIRADRKELLDDGWDIFENDAELYSGTL